MASSLQQRLQNLASDRLQRLHEIIETEGSPVFVALKHFFTRPLDFLRQSANIFSDLDKEKIIKTFEDLQDLLTLLFEKYNVGYSSIISVIFFFVAASLIYSLVIGLIDKTPEKKIYSNNWFSISYCFIWTLVLIAGFINMDIRSVFTVTSLLTDIKAFFSCVIVTLSVFLIVCAILATLPESSVVFPGFVFIGLAILKFYMGINVTSIDLCLALSFIFVVLAVVLIVCKMMKGFVNNFKPAFYYIYQCAHYLVPMFVITTIFQYFQLASLRSLLKHAGKNTSYYYILVFLFAWSFFSISYFNRLFTAIFIRSTYPSMHAKKENKIKKWHPPMSIQFVWSCVETFDALNYLSFLSAIPATIHTIISILQGAYIYMKRSNSALLQMLSYIVYIPIGVLKVFSSILDARVSSSLTQLGIHGKLSYFNIYKSDQIKIDSDPQSIRKNNLFTIFDLQFLGYIGVSIMFSTCYNLFFDNFENLVFSLFICLNVLILSFNALHTCHLVRKFYMLRMKKAEIVSSFDTPIELLEL